MLALQDTDAVPEPVTLLGVMLPQASPDGTVSARFTVPPKLFTAVTVTVVTTELPASTGREDWPPVVRPGSGNGAVRGVLGAPRFRSVSRVGFLPPGRPRTPVEYQGPSVWLGQ